MPRKSSLNIEGISKSGRGYCVTLIVDRYAGPVIRRKYFLNLDDAIDYKWQNLKLIKRT
jgi:hypothetical protein